MIEKTQFKKLALASTVSAMLLVSNVANAHVSYNILGANAGDAGGGAPGDGSGSVPNFWSENAPAYSGNLPATWVAFVHNDNGVANSVTANSADAAVSSGIPAFSLGMGAKAYKDGSTNWGMTSDFGLIELTHDATVTITVASDGSDLRPAFGLWSGWDTSGSGSRHGDYLNNGAINPMSPGVLGSTLSLVDPTVWAFAATQGATSSATLTRFLTAGDYTLILGGYDGTTGGANLAYTATISAAASPVPLPGAVWLFGGALMGWLRLQKRKMAA